MQLTIVSVSRPTGPAPSLRPHGLRPSFSSAPRKPRFVSLVSCAAASGDPYDVLGLPQNADYNAIQRAYKKKLRYVGR